jgi:hypothetical protein
MPTLFVAASRRPELEAVLRQLPGILAGTEADVGGIARGFKMRVSFAFFSLVKEAFIVKSRGGTDAAGIKWPPLSREYLAYTRPMNGRQPPRAGGLAPGGNDGFMTAAQLNQWRRDFAGAMKYLSVQIGEDAARGQAAAIAWSKAKSRGVRTKLEVFGEREVEILRDRGILFNSLSPGQINEAGVDATYSPPEDQVAEDGPGWLLVGTNVEYAYYHHVQPGIRPLWPKNGNLPAVWIDEIMEVAVSGLERIGELLQNGGL